MKRPSKEEFDTIGLQFVSLPQSERISSIAEHFGVTTRTIYLWEDVYDSGIEEKEKDMGKDFYTMLDEYRDEQIVPVRELAASVKKSCVIVFMSDTHLGSKFCDRKTLREHIERIAKTKRVFVIFVGDMIDWGPTGPQSLLADQAINFDTQRDLALKMADEIGHKVLAITSGCHSHFIAGGKMIEEEFAEHTLTKNFLHDGGILNLTVGEITYRIFMSHKLMGGSKMNPQRGLLRLNEFDLDFDIGIEAHKHCANSNQSLRRQKIITTINCGTYKFLDSYGNKKGFIGQPITIPGIYLDANERIMIPNIDWITLLRLL